MFNAKGPTLMVLITLPALPIEYCTQMRQVHTLLIITVITFSEARRVRGNNYEELLIYFSPKFLIAQTVHLLRHQKMTDSLKEGISQPTYV